MAHMFMDSSSVPLPFIKVEVFAYIRDKPIQYSISNLRGISWEEYRRIDKEAVIAFGNEGTKTKGSWADGFGTTTLGR